ncbi:MAG: FecR domain-containing protein [Fibrobacteres bacterium]|nr:FecR domain-containing protein [Fibrobacterota bacterium]
MKKLFLFSLLASFSLLSAESIGKVSYFVGSVKLKGGTAAEWKDAKINLPVTSGDQVKTDKSDRLEITLRDGSLIRISELSEITLTAPNGKTIAPAVKKGKIWANIKKLGQRNYDFEVTSSTATAAIRGTIFRMDELDSSTVVSVYDGKVAVGPGSDLKSKYKEKGQSLERKEVSGPQEVAGPYEVSLMDWVNIVKGQRISIKRDGKFAQEKIDMTREISSDDWVKFNMERDSIAGIKH